MSYYYNQKHSYGNLDEIQEQIISRNSSDSSKQSSNQDFSLIILNTNVLEVISDYMFTYSTSIRKTINFQIFKFCIFPLKLTGEWIKIQNNSLKIDFNKLILKDNFKLIQSGFKFNFNIKSGLLHLEYSCIWKGDQNDDFIERFEQRILRFYKRNSNLKKQFYSYIDMMKKDTTIPHSDFHLQQLTKFAYNSQFYAWAIKPFQNQLQPKKLQKWEDSEAQQQQSSFVSEESQSVSEKLSVSHTSASSSSLSLQSVKFSPFYLKHKSEYERLNVFADRVSFGEEMYEDCRASSDSLVRYYLSTEHDRNIYQSFLSKYMNKQSISITQDDTIQSPSQYSSSSSTPSTNSILLSGYLNANQISISKSTKWTIILRTIHLIYHDHYLHEFVSKPSVEVHRLIIGQGLKIGQIEQQENFEINSKFEYTYPSEKFNEETTILQLYHEQKKLALNIVNLIIWMFFSGKPLIDRMLQPYANSKDKRIIKCDIIDKWQQEIDEKYQLSNLTLENIFLYFYYKLKVSKNGPFGDWVIITSQYINQLVQI